MFSCNVFNVESDNGSVKKEKEKKNRKKDKENGSGSGEAGSNNEIDAPEAVVSGCFVCFYFLKLLYPLVSTIQIKIRFYRINYNQCVKCRLLT